MIYPKHAAAKAPTVQLDFKINARTEVPNLPKSHHYSPVLSQRGRDWNQLLSARIGLPYLRERRGYRRRVSPGQFSKVWLLLQNVSVLIEKITLRTGRECGCLLYLLSPKSRMVSGRNSGAEVIKLFCVEKSQQSSIFIHKLVVK